MNDSSNKLRQVKDSVKKAIKTKSPIALAVCLTLASALGTQALEHRFQSTHGQTRQEFLTDNPLFRDERFQQKETVPLDERTQGLIVSELNNFFQENNLGEFNRDRPVGATGTFLRRITPEDQQLSNAFIEIFNSAFANDKSTIGFQMPQEYLDEVSRNLTAVFAPTNEAAGFDGYAMPFRNRVFMETAFTWERDDESFLLPRQHGFADLSAHEYLFHYVLGFGESLSSLGESILNGSSFDRSSLNSMSSRRDWVYNPFFDAMLLRRGGEGPLLDAATTSNAAYGQHWNNYMGDIATFEQMQQVRSLSALFQSRHMAMNSLAVQGQHLPSADAMMDAIVLQNNDIKDRFAWSPGTSWAPENSIQVHWPDGAHFQHNVRVFGDANRTGALSAQPIHVEAADADRTLGLQEALRSAMRAVMIYEFGRPSSMRVIIDGDDQLAFTTVDDLKLAHQMERDSRERNPDFHNKQFEQDSLDRLLEMLANDLAELEKTQPGTSKHSSALFAVERRQASIDHQKVRLDNLFTPVRSDEEITAIFEQDRQMALEYFRSFMEYAYDFSKENGLPPIEAVRDSTIQGHRINDARNEYRLHLNQVTNSVLDRVFNRQSEPGRELNPQQVDLGRIEAARVLTGFGMGMTVTGFLATIFLTVNEKLKNKGKTTTKTTQAPTQLSNS